jgi:hypothetical protein
MSKTCQNSTKAWPRLSPAFAPCPQAAPPGEGYFGRKRWWPALPRTSQGKTRGPDKTSETYRKNDTYIHMCIYNYIYIIIYMCVCVQSNGNRTFNHKIDWIQLNNYMSPPLSPEDLTSQHPFDSGPGVQHTLALAHSQASQLLDTSAPAPASWRRSRLELRIEHNSVDIYGFKSCAHLWLYPFSIMSRTQFTKHCCRTGTKHLLNPYNPYYILYIYIYLFI